VRVGGPVAACPTRLRSSERLRQPPHPEIRAPAGRPLIASTERSMSDHAGDLVLQAGSTIKNSPALRARASEPKKAVARLSARPNRNGQSIKFARVSATARALPSLAFYGTALSPPRTFIALARGLTVFQTAAMSKNPGRTGITTIVRRECLLHTTQLSAPCR